MSFLKFAIAQILRTNLTTSTHQVNLAAQQPKKSHVSEIVNKTITRTRQDIKQWVDAQNLALSADNPKRYPLYNLYDNIMMDLHLMSQINNRRLKSLSTPFVIKNLKGEINQELTDLLNKKKFILDVNLAILDTVYYGHRLGEFSYNTLSELEFKIIPNQNVDPNLGLIYYDYTEDKKLNYRIQPEYGSWVVEFGKPRDFGLLNACVPHVLFKRFAESCWSELCEIYGIPPRILKTNTQDATLVNRGKKMMTEMGTAAWMIIDESESFEFAKGVITNGDVYNNLIKVCNNEMSMAIQGGSLGQDTKNGSNSKEQTTYDIFKSLVESDLTLIETYWNAVVIPALQSIGYLPKDIVYGYDPTEDLQQLWTMTKEALPYYDVDPEWVKDKFGIEITGARVQTGPGTGGTNLNLDLSGLFY